MLYYIAFTDIRYPDGINEWTIFDFPNHEYFRVEKKNTSFTKEHQLNIGDFLYAGYRGWEILR